MSILQSIKPEHCENIAIGIKTIEVRKTRPKIQTPFKVYIYETKFVNRCKDCEYCSFESIVMGRMRDVCKFEKDNWRITNLSSRCFQNKYSGGKVIGEYVCDEIQELRFDALEQCYFMRKSRGSNLDEEFMTGTCLSYKEAYEYCKNLKWDSEHTDMFYGWHISDLVLYDKPKELSEFNRYCDGVNDIRPCENGKKCEYSVYDYQEGCEACAIDFDGTNCPYLKVTRPPQSWCYVEDET